MKRLALVCVVIVACGGDAVTSDAGGDATSTDVGVSPSDASGDATTHADASHDAGSPGDGCIAGSSGAAIDGEDYVLDAPCGVLDFGESVAVTDFVGGAALETQADDTDFQTFASSNWSLPSWLSPNRWRVDDSRARARTKSILWDTTDPRNGAGGNHGEGTQVFDAHVASLGRVYIHEMLYLERPAATTRVQHKMLRFISQYKPEGASGVVDGETPNLLISNLDRHGVFGFNNGVTYPPYGSGASWFDDRGWTSATGVDPLPAGAWLRVEFELAEQSTPTASDALVSYRGTDPSTNAVVVDQVRDGIRIYADGETRPWKYITFQNGFYNGEPASQNEWGDCKVWMQDLYVSVGSRARVMLGDAPTWSAVTHAELQPVTSWSRPAIHVTLNRGTFTSLDGLYFYVWDADGRLLDGADGIPIR